MVVIDRSFGGVAEHLLATGRDDDIAFVSGETEHSYRRLRHDVATLATALVDSGMQRGSPVAVIAPNGAFWAAGYLAAMLAGLVAVPIPTVLTSAEVCKRMRWAGIKTAVAGARAAAGLRAVAGDDINLLTQDVLQGHQTSWDERPRVDIAADDEAAYLFTSGTTGEPRAVRITHRNIRANTESILGYLDLHRSDRALVVLPYSYVFGASLLHTHLRAGATLVDQPSVAFPEMTVRLLETARCTVFAGVPSNFHVLLRNSSFGRTALPDLRIVQQAGGRLPPALLTELITAHPNARVYVMYGQTEATARLSALDPDELLPRLGSIGRGIPGVELRVVNEDGVDVAPGEVGEVLARGENISPGYLNAPDASALKMPDGVLHTGDLATVDDEGYIYIVDRAEDFIKSWGYRIASQEVEAVAMELGGLISAAAVGIPDDLSGESVELLVVAREDAALSEADILAHCRSRLPKYSVPAAVHFGDRLPTNANGKVVKRQVRDLILSRRAERADADAR